MAPRTLFAIALLLSVAALAPVAGAQIPGQAPVRPCGDGVIESVPATLSFTPGDTQTVTVTARITNANPGADANVIVNLSAPAGWIVGPTQTLQGVTSAGATASFDVTAPSPMNADGRQETLDVRANFICFSSFNGNRQSIQDMADPAPLKLALAQRAPSAAAPFLNDSTLLAAGAVGLVVIVGAAVFLLTRKRGGATGLRLSCAEPEKRVRPGRGTSFPVRVDNLTDAPESVRLEVLEVPDGWTAFMANEEVQLAPRDGRIVWLLVRAPADGTAEGPVGITVRAHPKDGAREKPTLRVTAVAVPGPSVEGVDDVTGVRA